MSTRAVSFDEPSTYASHPTPYAERFTNPSTHILDTSRINHSYEMITYVRLYWVDLVNIVRYRVIPWAQFVKSLKPKLSSGAASSTQGSRFMTSPINQRRGFTIGSGIFGLVGFQAAPGVSPIGEWLWIPDQNSLRICHYEGFWIASVFGWFTHKGSMMAPAPQTSLPIAASSCTRSLLARVIRYAHEVAKIKFLVGIESEFVLISDTANTTPVNNHSFCETLALPTGSRESTVLREIADNLQKSDIELYMYHAEGTEGQYEVITGPLSPLEAADAIVFTRETIMNTASKHGLRATFSPRVFANAPGSAAHTHISIQSTVNHVKDIPPSSIAPNLNAIEAAFLSSFLEHLPAIQAFSQPFPASYLRVVDGIWSGGTYVSWGTDNREAPVRLVDSEPGNEESRRFEIRPIDGLSNPYLVLAAILGAGALGVAQNATLSIRDLTTGGAADLTEQQRLGLGIRERLSLSWEEARAALEKDQILVDFLGKEFVRDYLGTNATMVGYMEADKTKARQKYVENY